MEPSVITEGRYAYTHDPKAPPEAIDVHHIMVSRTTRGGFIFCTYALVFASIGFHMLFFLPDKPVASFIGINTLTGFILRQLLRKQVEKESVVILPGFGIQLETTYRSGKTVRHFVPIGKILKPVLNECVTPVSCYWRLSLILRGEEELFLVVKELYPPVTLLVPIWKSLCAAIDDEKCTGVHSDYGGLSNCAKTLEQSNRTNGGCRDGTE
ncbi:hypothetical protein CASFOL_015821 [Castilleja foliolosa]|uniref:Phosphatidylinositol N-acetylglucosaminyltransferase subunit H conserved domain-containing protein n=1 Tax=Castilleja foliolosa TaxID=1961234 RepID=A0ABD3DF71_9LAMI